MGGLVTSVQFVVVRSEFRCKVKLIEGMVQDRRRLVPEGEMLNLDALVDCAI